MEKKIAKELADANIRALIDDRVSAVRAKDPIRATAHFDEEILSFDVVNPLQHVGLGALRKRVDEWFSAFDGPIGFEIQDLRITTGDDVAFSHSLNHVSATMKGGNKVDMWWRATVCYCRVGGDWRVTHEHNSVPFDTATGQASLALRP